MGSNDNRFDQHSYYARGSGAPVDYARARACDEAADEEFMTTNPSDYIDTVINVTRTERPHTCAFRLAGPGSAEFTIKYETPDELRAHVEAVKETITFIETLRQQAKEVSK